MMHGSVIQPVGDDVPGHRRHPAERLRAWAWRHRWFLTLVMLPTLVAAFYLFVIASDQYQSETHFLVRTAEPQRPQASGLSQILAGAGGGGSSTPEAMSVADYLTSHDVVESLKRDYGLVQRYQRPEIDVFSRLPATPTDEKLLRYYRARAKVEVDSRTGITSVRVRAFTAKDAYDLTRALMELGDRRINSLNRQAYQDQVSRQEAQLSGAEEELNRAQRAISAFRESRRDIDPTGTGEAQTTLIATLTANLAALRAQMTSVGQTISRDSPQYVALARQVRAMEAQIANQQARLAGRGSTIASGVANYNDLQLRQQFAAKRYEAVATALDRAREQTVAKQLYLVRVVNPNMPGKAEYPQRFRILATLFLGVLLTYAIGWLLLAGMREHAA